MIALETKHRRPRRWHAPLLALAVAGCTTVLRPVAKLPDAAQTPQLKVAGAVDVASLEVDPRPHRFAASPYSVDVHYADFTDATVRLLRLALERQGATLAPDGRRLGVAVTYVSVVRSPSTLACVVDYRVRLGAGGERGVQSRATSWSFTTACDAAVGAGVAAILRDPAVAEFLRQ